MATPSMHDLKAILDEASLKDLASSAMNKVHAAAGNQQAKGKEDAKKLAGHMKDLYRKYLGQSGGEPNEETLMTFLVDKVGFTADNVKKLFGKVGIQDPTKMESLQEAITKQNIDALFLAAAQFAYAHDLVPQNADDKDENEKKGTFKSQKSAGGFGPSYSRNSRDPRTQTKMGSAEQELRAKNAENEKQKADPFTSDAIFKKLESFTGKTGMDPDSFDWLEDVVGETKGNYKGLSQVQNSGNVRDQFARLGYALMLYHVTNSKK